MITENVAQAKAHLPRLIAAAERGEDVFISRRGQPAVRLVPATSGVRFPIRPCPPEMRVSGDPADFDKPAVDLDDIEAYK